MKKHLFIELMALLAMIIGSSTASAKDRLWMVTETAGPHANYQIEAGKFYGVSSGNELAGERLWMARENALRQSGRTKGAFDMAGSQKMISAGTGSSGPQNRLVCGKKKPAGPPTFFKGHDHVTTEPGNC